MLNIVTVTFSVLCLCYSLWRLQEAHRVRRQATGLVRQAVDHERRLRSAMFETETILASPIGHVVLALKQLEERDVQEPTAELRRLTEHVIAHEEWRQK